MRMTGDSARLDPTDPLDPAASAGSSDGARHLSSAPVAIHDMTVAYHRRPVLWDIDFDARPGKLTAIVGPNGSGTVSYTHLTLPTICSV